MNARDEVRSLMPPAIIEAVDSIVQGLISELGESPEAWRGAFEAIDIMINRPLITYLSGDRDEMTNPDKAVITMMMTVLGQFLSDERTLAVREIQNKQQKERET